MGHTYNIYRSDQSFRHVGVITANRSYDAKAKFLKAAGLKPRLLYVLVAWRADKDPNRIKF